MDFDVVCNERAEYSNGPHAHADDMLFVPLDGVFSVSSDGRARADVLASGSLWLVPGHSVHQVMASPGQRHLCYYLDMGRMLAAGHTDDGASLSDSRKWGVSSFLMDLLRLRGHLGRKSVGASGLRDKEVDQMILREVGRIVTSVPPALHGEPGAVVREVKLFIANHLDADLSCEALARQFRTSERTLARWFHSEQGQPIAQYVHQTRVAEARRLLASTTLTIVDIQGTTGFSTASHFAYAMRRAFGASPRRLREGDWIWQEFDTRQEFDIRQKFDTRQKFDMSGSSTTSGTRQGG